MDREQLYQRINLRVDLMIKEGLVEEARQFVDKKHLSALKTVGYQELFDAFEDQITLKEGIDRIKNNSRKYARKQLSWIRRDKEYQWFEPQMKSEILDYIEKRIKA
jgi:tRNA dimethylallyltransferase